jgi:RNA polymerase sigma-70 factor, ECF subfamily
MITYGNDIKRLIYTYVRDHATADDLTQLTFITCYDKFHQFKGENLKSWLYKIAVNKAKDHLKSAYTRRVSIEEPNHSKHLIPSVEKELMQKESQNELTNIRITNKIQRINNFILLPRMFYK